MGSSIYVPTKIRVGVVDREDTYTKKLAYVIYYDGKGKLRKETSWRGWLDQNKSKHPPQDYTNEPTSGFILNKDAGGHHNYRWDYGRQLKIRIFDPRGFEFEIEISNLLYILQNTDCLKGKGLEGSFVYGWDGTDLLLIPTSAPEYKEISEYSSLISAKTSVKTKDLVAGGTYLSNKNVELIYLGRFEEWDTYRSWSNNGNTPQKSLGKKFFFQEGESITTMTSISGRILKCVSNTPVDNYADLMDSLECNSIYSPVDQTADKFLPLTEEVLKAGYHTKSFFTYDNINWRCEIWSKWEPNGRNNPFYYLHDEQDNNYWGSSSRFQKQKTELEKLGKNSPDLMTLIKRLNITYRQRYLVNGKAAKV